MIASLFGVLDWGEEFEIGVESGVRPKSGLEVFGSGI